MHNRVRILLLLPVLFLALAFLPVGTASLSGTVSGASGGKISNAKIELLQSGTVIGSALSDAQGAYVLKNLPAGTFTLRARKSNYKTYTGTVTLADNKAAVQNITLTEISVVVDIKEEAETQTITAAPAAAGSTTVTNSSPAYSGKAKRSNSTAYMSAGYAAPSATYNAYSTSAQTYSWTPSGTKSMGDVSYGSVSNGDSTSLTGTESYDRIVDNRFQPAQSEPLSTFSIDVDHAAYSNMRRYINDGQLPPKDAVRIEEMVNYFSYNYPQPTGNDPFSINTEVALCPWNPTHQLVEIGLQGKDMDASQLPPSNLVFLIDVSGSMESPNKLPLVKTALNILIDRLRPQDKVTIVVYAGAAGEVLPPTPGTNKQAMRDAISRLNAGGSTAGGAGIELAYKRAKENFIEQGNNRVILATDGDFNVGVSSDADLEKLIEEKRKDGVFLTTLGFGMGNYKDSKMETLADKGNGNYSYIDNALEAEKVFVKEFGGTLFTIAKDVKLQVEFNPAQVKAYRLIGYENRMLNKEDFNDDKKDAGELGCGHTVTALYEIIPAGSKENIPGVDSLKYQQAAQLTAASSGSDLMTVKFRYKEPTDSVSKLIVHPLSGKAKPFDIASENLRFAASVAEFGMLLRGSPYKGFASFTHVRLAATAAKGKDTEGYREEFLKLVKQAEALSGPPTSASMGGSRIK